MTFTSQQEWDRWLSEHHTELAGIWMRILKKGSGLDSINYAEALDVALCYGWIDGQKKSCDAESWLQRFTPRRSKSRWSKINRGHVERLAVLGRMKRPGLMVVEDAKADGRWDAAYTSSANAEVPADFQEALEANQVANVFFMGLDRANRYALLYRIEALKRPETRAKRIHEFIEMLTRGEKLHP